MKFTTRLFGWCLNPRRMGVCVALVGILVSGGCGPDQQTDQQTELQTTDQEAHDGTPAESDQTAARRFAGAEFSIPPDMITVDADANATRQAYFGDLHVHTDYSFDAFAFGTIASPYDAYEYAQGEAIRHPAGFMVQLDRPLDFYAVTDHAMFLGAMRAAADTTTAFSRLEHVQDLHDLNAPENLNIDSLPARVTAFSTFLTDTVSGLMDGSVDAELVNGIARDAWSDIVRAAETHNRPGEFTTFVAYEYTSSTDDRGNLHRNVFFEAADRLPAIPFSRFHSQDPEGLWDWLDGLRSQGVEAMAIPHNANGSNGQMFKLVDWAGDPLDEEYASKRVRNEPLIELTQVKGTSETHPLLSDTDEWADFEIMPYRVATTLPSEPKGSYARDALLSGLKLADSGITNAYQFGFVGASDTHTGAASLDEANFFSKVGLLDSNGGRRGSVPLSAGDAEVIRAAGRVDVREIDGRSYASGAYETWSAAGLTGVWAERNDRAAIYQAFRRKETFATSGPRIKVRLFAGFGLSDVDDIPAAYADGVAMGGELHGTGNDTPTFLLHGHRDPNSAPLQRLQIVKGWLEGGEAKEQVFDVACSDGGVVDSRSHRCPDNGAQVDLADCSITPGVGAAALATVWRDPTFAADQRAFYYARVLENPTCRWSTWDALRAGVEPRDDLPRTIQERAWSSPIWYTTR